MDNDFRIEGYDDSFLDDADFSNPPDFPDEPDFGTDADYSGQNDFGSSNDFADDFDFNDDQGKFSSSDEPVSQGSLGQLDVYADIVYCIDLTASMSPIINKVKEIARTLHTLLQEAMMKNYQRNIKQLRIKVIGFRDIYCDGKYAFEKSDGFFYLPEQNAEFEAFINTLEAKGGGDIPESSLEAIAEAIKSDWCTTLDNSVRKRHVIVLFTDASAHPLEMSEKYTGTNYPEGMPKSYTELVDWWNGQGSAESDYVPTIDQIAKRLAIYAPEGSEPWTFLADDFDTSFVENIEPNKGGEGITTANIIKLLAETMT